MATKKQSRHKGPALTWRRPKDLNELWEAVAPGGGRYVIRMIGAYRTGATRYEVNLRGASYHSAYLNHFKTATTAKRVAGAHANRLAARMRATPQGTTTHGPWDSAGGKRRSAGGKRRGGGGIVGGGAFVTSFCNFPHSLKTGRPIGHECYILSVKGLWAERDGRFDEAMNLFEAQRGSRVIVKGRSRPSSTGAHGTSASESSRLGALVSDINKLTR